MKRSIEQVSGGLSLTLKGDVESSVLSLRTELKRLNSALEDLDEDLGGVCQVSKRIETRLQEVESAQDRRFDEAGAQVAERVAGVEERLSKLGGAQLHHISSALKAVSADIQVQSAETRDYQRQLLAKLDEIVSAVAGRQAQVQTAHDLFKRRFILMCSVLGLNFGVLLVLLVTEFL